MALPGTRFNYGYFSHRRAPYPTTTLFGLQAVIMEYLQGIPVASWMVNEARTIHKNHMPNNTVFNEAWSDLIGRPLPIEIYARREGTVWPVGTPLFTIQNTNPDFEWLAGHLDPLLTHVWYPSTIATQNFHMRKMFKRYTGDWPGLDFMLHDFGFRGVSHVGAARMGGMAHLLSFKGTDTLEGMRAAAYYYNASYKDLAFSVPATEHKIMTAMGVRYSDIEVVKRLIPIHAGGILSVVADSYDYKNFVKKMILLKPLIDKYMVKLVIRPDSVPPEMHTPTGVVLWTLDEFRQTGLMIVDNDSKMLLQSSFGLLWGDGLDRDEITNMLGAMTDANYSAKNVVYGMGGGLLQKVNRDTLSSAIKSSAQNVDGQWHDVWKETPGKSSLRGRFKDEDLELVFRDGQLVKFQSFNEVRANLLAADNS